MPSKSKEILDFAVVPRTLLLFVALKTNSAKSKLSADFLFSKTKEDKKSKENGGSEVIVNKESEAIA